MILRSSIQAGRFDHLDFDRRCFPPIFAPLGTTTHRRPPRQHAAIRVCERPLPSTRCRTR